MEEFRIEIDLRSILPDLGTLDDLASLPHLQDAIREVAEHGRRRWQAYASGAPLPGGQEVRRRHQKPYAASIGVRQIGEFEAEIFTDYRFAPNIEHGEDPVDLKKALYTSRKVRISRGRRYLIIPFTWRTAAEGADLGKNDMEPTLTEWWRTRGWRRVGEAGGSAFRGIEARQLYSSSDLTIPGKARNQLRMQATANPGARGQKITRGNLHTTTFKTFRTMMEGSPGWVIPAKPPVPVAATVEQEIRDEAEQVFREAAAADVAMALQADPRAGFRPRWKPKPRVR
jgi:hypothetical protein